MLNLILLCSSYLKYNFKFEIFMKFWYRGQCPSHLFSDLWPCMKLIKELTKKARKWHPHSKTLWYAQDYWLICSYYKFLGSYQLPTDHRQGPVAQILKKYFDAQKSESFHPLPSGTHCALPDDLNHRRMSYASTANANWKVNSLLWGSLQSS